MNYFRGRGINPEYFNKEASYIIENFLVEEAITIYYAPPKHGKSRLALGLTKYLYKNTNKIVQYFDFDNPQSALKERGTIELLKEFGDRVDYIHSSTTPFIEQEVIDKLVEEAKPNAYSEYVFIFDSIANFVGDVKNDTTAKKFMFNMQKIRDAGATIILLHHTNKNEKNYEGSPAFKSAVDNMYYMHQGDGTEKNDLFLLDVVAGRFNVSNAAFYLDNKTYELSIALYDQAVIKPEEQAFINMVKEVLKKHPNGIGQSELLKACGKEKFDRHARAYLSSYTERFWKVTDGQKNSKIYHIL